ncbi:unnamed protein product, partial [Mesorhabditis spiculigera]
MAGWLMIAGSLSLNYVLFSGGVIVLLAYYLFPRSTPQPIPARRPIVIEEDEEKKYTRRPGGVGPSGPRTLRPGRRQGDGVHRRCLRFHNIEETLKTALIIDGVAEDGIDTSGSHVFCQFEAGTASVRTTCPVKKGTRLIGVLSFKLPAEAAGLLVKLAKEMADDPEGFMGKMAIESIADVPIDKYETRYIQFHRLGYYICVKGPDVPLPTRRARLDRVAEVWKRACREQDIALFRVVVFHIDAYHATWFTSDFLLEMPDDMVVLGHIALETYKMVAPTMDALVNETLKPGVVPDGAGGWWAEKMMVTPIRLPEVEVRPGGEEGLLGRGTDTAAGWLVNLRSRS